MSNHAWINIDAGAFHHNVAQYDRIVRPETMFAMVLKSNAYGHGLQTMAILAQENRRVNWACTFFQHEAITLRESGFTKPILVLGGPDISLHAAAAYNLDVEIHDHDQLWQLTESYRQYSRPINVHLKVDTGLSRLGFLPEEFLNVVEKITNEYPFLRIRGLMTHFAESGALDDAFTREQEAKVITLVGDLVRAGVYIPIIHSANSAATLRFPQMHQTMVRVGGGFYGLKFEEAALSVARAEHVDFSLKPLLSLNTGVMSLKTVAAGCTVGYDRLYHAQSERRVAVVPVGYADGFGLRQPHEGRAYIGGRIVPTLGSMSMNMHMVDVTDLPGIVVGEQVTLIGPELGVRAIDIAQRTGAVPYEVTTNLSSELNRNITGVVQSAVSSRTAAAIF